METREEVEFSSGARPRTEVNLAEQWRSETAERRAEAHLSLENPFAPFRLAHWSAFRLNERQFLSQRKWRECNELLEIDLEKLKGNGGLRNGGERLAAGVLVWRAGSDP